MWITAAITFIKANKWLQYVLGGVALVLALWIALSIHDSNVRKAERARIEAQAKRMADKAISIANKAQEQRDEGFRESQNALANSDDPAAYLRSLRESQCRTDKAAC